jgi:hypothetical protein
LEDYIVALIAGRWPSNFSLMKSPQKSRTKKCSAAFIRVVIVFKGSHEGCAVLFGYRSLFGYFSD